MKNKNREVEVKIKDVLEKDLIEEFCDECGFDFYSLMERGGEDAVVDVSIEKAKKFNLDYK